VGVPGPDGARGVYGISVAAQLVDMGVQTLQLYEARGLLEPERTEGGTRRYSANDLDRLRRIGDLLGAGLNLAGIAGAEPATAKHPFLLIEHLGRRRQLVRIDPDDHGCHAAPPRLERCPDEARRATLLRAGQTLLEPLHAAVPGQDARHE
jgi:MerR family transcriptional regulator, heat shock protein HspR